MKWLFLLLLIANLLFYGYSQFAEPTAAPDWRSREVNADKIKLISAEAPEPGKPGVDSAATATEPKPADAKPAEPTPAEAPAPLAAQDAANSCMVWKGLPERDLLRAKSKLKALKLANAPAEQLISDGPTKFWVYIPPRNTLAEAQRKGDELKGLKIDDYYVVNDGGKWQNAISLGIFSTREAADRRLESLRTVGVKSAVVRERGDGVHSATLSLSGISSEQKEKLQALAAEFKGTTLDDSRCSR
ncbi:SPOR domain-containing protein [Parachitinimonas caeni]|uniref:SPOR domain-containing protein n=1 Tax=Parachitinimonas caeni TaxID=3031301 RepID=A0ABT7DT50_9NEIS|nr:SPOR domain-containing protein [Parachitinimonas caeni]MDK2123243.1 SPOR domain-containing protein [Parachitinimonas caeni]